MAAHTRLSDRHPRVAVFTVKNDMHALLLRARLINDFGIACHIVETEELALAGDFSWTPDGAWLMDSESVIQPVAGFAAPAGVGVRRRDVLNGMVGGTRVALVVAPTSVKGFRLIRIDRAVGPLPITRSSA